MTIAQRFALFAALLLTLLPVHARAQIFIASRPDPPFEVGPLTIRATVTPSLTPVEVEVRWALDVPTDKSRVGIEQDIFLLWPGEVTSPLGQRTKDDALARYVEARGFTVLNSGRLPLYAQNLYAEGVEASPKAAGEVPYVVFVQDSHALGLSRPGTWIRIPWTPQMANATFMMSLHMHVEGVIKPRQLHWFETVFTGERHEFSLSFHEVRDRPIFPMYAEHRDRAVRLADAPAELVVQFPQSDRLKIDDVYPPTAIRRLSETLQTTELVSLFLDRSDGITPQQLAVQFGYFSRTQAAALVAAPLLLLVLGQAMGPLLGRGLARAIGMVGARVQLGAWRTGGRQVHQGVILPRDVLERIVPGKTTRDEVIRLCGAEVERQDQFPGSGRTTLIYRGRRLVPEARRIFGWLSTVRRWDVERHEVRIELDGDLVRDVQAEVRRYRLGPEEPR